MKTILLVLCLLLMSGVSANSDSLHHFTIKQFFAVVLSNHPMAKAAGLKVNAAEAYLQKARGNFDPKLKLSTEDKFYKNTNYFNLLSSGISVPTMGGLELKTGYDYNRGLNLNPENILPDAGLLYAGLTLSVGQGLLIDERRAVLAQAKIQRVAGVAEQQAMLNDLLYDAGKYYWNWFAAYHQLQVFRKARTAAFERLQAVKSAAEFGDRPSVDTLEASIQFQERQLSLMQSELAYKNAGIELALYLWDAEMRPYALASKTVPPDLDSATFEPDLEVFFNKDWWMNHPEYRLYSFKKDQLLVEKRWKKEQLKPLLNLSYQPLTAANQIATWSTNDYKFGVTFSMPLLLRKERGELAITKFKIKETEYNMAFKSTEILTKFSTAFNEYGNLSDQLTFYRNTVDNYAALLNAEKDIFNNGESSLFMINAREMSYISASLKLIDIAVKARKASLMLRYASGQLYNF